MLNKEPDQQAGFEMGINCVLPALAGANFIHTIEDIGVSVVDTEKYIFYDPPNMTKYPKDSYLGDPIAPGSVLSEAIQKIERVVRE